MAASTTITTKSRKRNGKKYFTLDEARRALPLVKRVVADIQSTQAHRLHLHSQLSDGLNQISPVEQEHLQDDFQRATARLESLIDELTKIGVDLKDPSRGLLDFPAQFQGREVLLCWKADEETIDHWHEVHSGFAGRKPISQLQE